MENIKKLLETKTSLLIVLVLGLTARLALAARGHNFDMESWYVVADIARHGGNVYAETDRYNYGPVWYYILRVLDLLSGHRHEVLRYLIAGCLTLADLGICFVLRRQFGNLAAALFFLNPVSIIVTGYHGQFDNVAILLGLWSVRLMGDEVEGPVSQRQFAGLLILGLSLMTKHLFFAFPFWLAVRQKGLARMIMVVFVPLVSFVLSFAPYWAGGWNSIMLNVFDYYPVVRHSIYDFIIPPTGYRSHACERAWYAILMLFAFGCRRKNGFESLLIYTGVLVAFSPATSNQYLAIPVALAAAYPSLLFFGYTAVATVFLCQDVDGPHLLNPLYTPCNVVALYVLALGLVWLLCRTWFFPGSANRIA